jgi:hypothetical protein
MNVLTSPGSLVTIAGATLTVIGSIAYATDSPTISLAGVFYGVPILLGGLALKSSELPPAERLTPASQLRNLREQATSEPLRKLLGDVTRWRYGQKAHLESSLEALKLWDEDEPPQLLSAEEFEHNGGYGLALIFQLHGVPLERWQAREDRLGRFFGKGLEASLEPLSRDRLRVRLRPVSVAAANEAADSAADPAASTD